MEEKLQNIRTLLERYYDGTTTPAEEAELSAFFLSAPEIPSDMEPDRRLFCAIAEDDCAEVPAGLKASLEEMLQQKVKHSQVKRLWISIISSAAAVALVVGIIFRSQPPLQTEPEKLADNIEVAVTEPVEEPEIVEIVTEEPRPVEEKVESTPVKKRVVKSVQRAPKPYREVTDPDEAMREAEKALLKVSLALRPMHRACADVEDDLEKLDNKLNNLLK